MGGLGGRPPVGETTEPRRGVIVEPRRALRAGMIEVLRGEVSAPINAEGGGGGCPVLPPTRIVSMLSPIATTDTRFCCARGLGGDWLRGGDWLLPSRTATDPRRGTATEPRGPSRIATDFLCPGEVGRGWPSVAEEGSCCGGITETRRPDLGFISPDMASAFGSVGESGRGGITDTRRPTVVSLRPPTATEPRERPTPTGAVDTLRWLGSLPGIRKVPRLASPLLPGTDSAANAAICCCCSSCA